MLKDNIEKALNEQVQVEGESSQFYLAMASWAETEGYQGTADFLYSHADEEREHMLKLVKYINERGGHAKVQSMPEPRGKFKGLNDIFGSLLEHEVEVTQAINKVVDVCLQEKDYTTHNFMQWYVSEQLEEETLARTLIDKLNIINDDPTGLYIFDNELKTGSVGE